MNKINKKPKRKTFNKSESKSIEKSPNKSDKKSPKVKNKDNQQSADDSDNDLKQELNQIINDFNRGNKKPKNKTSKEHANDQKLNGNRVETKEEKSTSNWNQSTEPKTKRKTLIRNEIKWFELRVFDELNDTSVQKYKYDSQRAKELRKEAEDLLRTDIEIYLENQDKNVNKKEDFDWIRTVLKSGVLADKLSAHTVLIQDSAVHNLRSIETMLSMVNTKAKRECIMALNNLRDLFVGDLLIPDKKLKTFAELLQFFDDKNKDKKSRNKQLIICLFEDKLKSLYRQFLDQLVTVSHDSVDTTKQKALVTFYDLLVNNGEQEQLLLSSLVNKVGDPIPKLAAQAVHLLNQLINQHHPFMKTVVVEEMERLLYRPNIKERAQYYGLCFLSEIIFGGADRPLANKMIELYFGFFKSCIKKGDVNNKMMSVLLTGVSRAFPYSKLDTSLLEDNLETFYKLIHYVNNNTAIQALCLIFNIIDDKQSGLLTDRYYAVLYRQMTDIQLDNCSRTPMFLNLIYRAMKMDPILKRVRAFIKRLLQIGLTQYSSLSAAVLILIAEVMKEKPGLSLNKEVINVDIVAKDEDNDEDDDDEHYEDVPLSDDETKDPEDKEKDDKEKDVNENNNNNSKEKISSWVHNKNIDINRTKTRHYDPNLRNPLFAGAELSDLWELNLMKANYHPSTSLFAQKILDNEPIDYSGDPISDFSVKHFLDRFVFRNPKKHDKNSSKASRVFGRLPTSDGQMTINSKSYVNQPESRIPIDEKFIYDYMKRRVTFKVDGNDSDADSVSDGEFDALLDRLEPMSKQDFARDVYKKSKDKKKTKDSDSEANDESDDDFGEEGDEDDDMEFDEDDPEFAEAFGGIDSELEDALEGEEDEDEDNGRPKKRRKGFDKMSNELFASADEFAQLLEGNESDSGLSDAEVKTDRKTEFRNRRNLGRNKNKHKKRSNKKDLDL